MTLLYRHPDTVMLCNICSAKMTIEDFPDKQAALDAVRAPTHICRLCRRSPAEETW